MLIRAITKNTEESLLSAIESKKSSSGIKSFLQCSFSKVKFDPPSADNLILLLKDIIKELNAILYLCGDKDVFIEWAGASKGIVTAIQREIAKYCLEKNANWNPDQFFSYYDLNANGEELRIICKQKIALLNPDKFKFTRDISNKDICFNSVQYRAFDNSIKTRSARKNPEVLIVEDQAFSRTLLTGILSHKYQCYIAKNALEAIDVFSWCAPDVILLDIELPDASGHEVAKFIRSVDTNVWIIMVTANNYQSDVITAKKNEVQGFIAKPYNKGKILEIMNNFERSRK